MQPDPAKPEPDGRPSVLVIGGGLAGIAAAVTLARHGVAVKLAETSKRLGGRATSFVDPATGEILDNCQHVLMGCCTNLRDLYDRLEVAGQIKWHRNLYFAGRNRAGRMVIDRLEAGALPAPLHLAVSLLRFVTLCAAEKMAIARGMLAMIRSSASQRSAWHQLTFAKWLDEHRQPPGAVSKFWFPVIVSALNEQPDRVAADYAVKVFYSGFLPHEKAWQVGLPTVPLLRLYDAAAAVITATGGQVLLSTGAQELLFDANRICGLKTSAGRRLEADAYLSAVPFDRLARLCGPPMRRADARLSALDRLKTSPILGIHLWFALADSRPLMRLPHLVLTESRLQWLFNKGIETATGAGQPDPPAAPGSAPAGKGQVQHLHGVISAAHDLVQWPADRIAAMAADEVARFLPAAGALRLVNWRVIKEKRATFSAAPGVDRWRPPARGPIGNLYLAGDWCSSGWPATMEGAVRSGYQAAESLLTDWGRPDRAVVADLPPRPLFSLLASRPGR